MKDNWLDTNSVKRVKSSSRKELKAAAHLKAHRLGSRFNNADSNRGIIKRWFIRSFRRFCERKSRRYFAMRAVFFTIAPLPEQRFGPVPIKEERIIISHCATEKGIGPRLISLALI